MCACAIVLCASACKPKQASSTGLKQPASKGTVSEPGLQDSHSVLFDIEPVQSSDGSRAFLAAYKSQGKIARFRFEIGPGKEFGSETPQNFKFVTGEGAIIAEPGSDASVLVADLKKALEAKYAPKNFKRASRLPFDYVILGQNRTRDPDGGFRSNPPGTWTAMKIFINSDKGDDEGEVFLDFSTITNKAEFAEKDVEYGDLVLAKLATVL
jgi:hypothetical protein